MRKFYQVLIIVALICLYANPALSMTKDEYIKASQSHFKGTITLENFLTLSKAELEGDAKDDPEYIGEVYANMAYAYFKQNSLNEAKIYNAKALELVPKSGRANYTHALILGEEKKYVEAIEHLKTCIGIIQKNIGSKEGVELKNAMGLKTIFKSKMRTYQEEIAITPQELWTAFDENEIAAEDKYKGKYVVIKGKIASITTNITGHPVVSFDVDKFGLATVNCIFPKESRSIIASLKKGQMILIPGGICDGMSMGQVFIKDCEV